MDSEVRSQGVTVWVLLATYYGGRYLSEFLTSLKASTYSQWVLLVYDDGSEDETLDILQSFSRSNPEKVRWTTQGNHRRRGAKEAFAYLAEQVLSACDERDLFVFADQDDIWEPNKLRCLLEHYHKSRQCHGDVPLLLFSDLTVIDEGGALLSPSLMSMQHSRPQCFNLCHALVQNSVTGCASLVNFRLLSLAAPIPEDAIMHDWWLALIACCFGRAVYLPERLVRYRQHEANAIGAKKYGLAYALTHLWAGFQGGSQRIQLHQLVQQARALSKHPDFLALAGPDSVGVVRAFTALPDHTFLTRRQLMKRYGINRPGWFRNVALAIDLFKL